MSTIDALARLCQAPLTEVQFEWFEWAGKRVDLVRVRFATQAADLIVECDAMGWGLRTRHGPLDPGDMGELGATAVEDAEAHDVFGGGRIEDVRSLTVDLSPLPIGVALISDNGVRTYLFNWGDDLVLTHDLYPGIAVNDPVGR